MLVLTWLLTEGALTRGDILVLDNAKVHYAANIRNTVEALLRVTGVQMIFLPAYSPELNPCELIFQLAKAALRHRRGDLPLWLEAQRAFAGITHELVLKEYKHCILSVLL